MNNIRHDKREVVINRLIQLYEIKCPQRFIQLTRAVPYKYLASSLIIHDKKQSPHLSHQALANRYGLTHEQVKYIMRKNKAS